MQKFNTYIVYLFIIWLRLKACTPCTARNTPIKISGVSLTKYDALGRLNASHVPVLGWSGKNLNLSICVFATNFHRQVLGYGGWHNGANVKFSFKINQHVKPPIWRTPFRYLFSLSNNVKHKFLMFGKKCTPKLCGCNRR